MSVALGSLLGAGLLLMAAPYLWPRAVDVRPARDGLATRWRARLARAGFAQLGLGAFIAISLICAAAAGAVLQATLGVTAVAILGGIGGFSAPAAIVMARARARMHANRAVWSDAIDHVVSAVRSGLALPDAISALAHSGPESTRAAFAGFERDYRATGHFSSCIDRLKDALADPIADRILETIRMAREVGGTELTTVLRDLAAYLRQDAAVRSEVEARQSWVHNAARLGVVAPWITLALLATRPEAAAAYNTSGGALLIGGGLVVSILAYRIMMAIGRLPEERRWFQ